MNEQLQTELGNYLDGIGAVAGTLHLCEGNGLRLIAAVRIPEVVQQALAWVPSGKGMAELSLERGQAMTTCNLVDDRSGNVRPGAKAVNAQAAVALPLRSPAGAIVAVLGAAFAEEREITEGELTVLTERAQSLLDAALSSQASN